VLNPLATWSRSLVIDDNASLYVISSITTFVRHLQEIKRMTQHTKRVLTIHCWVIPFFCKISLQLALSDIIRDWLLLQASLICKIR